MKASGGFIFFVLFLAGLALVNLIGVQDTRISAPEEIADVAWRPTQLEEVALGEDNTLFVQFAADGAVTGNGGCNRFFGTSTITREVLNIAPLGATRKNCPDSTMTVENSFMNSLQEATSGARLGDLLVLRNEADSVTLRLSAIERVNEQE